MTIQSGTACYHFFSIDVLASISVNFPGLFPLFLLVNVNMCLFHLVAINAKPLLQANNGAIASGKCITSHLALTEKKNNVHSCCLCTKPIRTSSTFSRRFSLPSDS